MIQLDSHQKRLAEWKSGAVVDNAAAGSGKSSTLLERIVFLLENGVPSSKILTLVYNAAAAESFRQRLTKRLQEYGMVKRRTIQSPPVHTFHAFARDCLFDWFKSDPEWKSMKLIEGGAGIRYALDALKACGIEADDAKPFLNISSLIREKCIPLEDEMEAFREALELPQFKGDHVAVREAVAFSKAYQRVKANASVYDFGDMMSLCIRLLEDDESLQNLLAAKYAHVQIDECQDVSLARWRLARYAAAKAESFALVGDFRQSINSFAGSDYTLVQEFYRSGEATLLTMPVNRRSARSIVELGNKVCAGRPWHLGGDAKWMDDAPEGNIQIWNGEEEDEVDSIVELLLSMQSEGMLVRQNGKPKVAILSRTNAGLIHISSGLRRARLFHRVRRMPGGVWSGKEGQAFLLYLRAAEDHSGFDGIEEIANKPVRYLKKIIVQQCVTTAQRTRRTLVDVLDGTYGREGRAARVFAQDLRLLQDTEFDRRCEIISTWLQRDAKQRRGNSAAMLSPDNGEAATTFRKLCEDAQKAGSYSALIQLIDEMAREEVKALIELSTIHGYKGEEADLVIVVGCYEGHMPIEFATTDDALDEERRIFYVAVTRAKLGLVLSVGGDTPSRYLTELGLLEEIAQRDDYPLGGFKEVDLDSTEFFDPQTQQGLSGEDQTRLQASFDSVRNKNRRQPQGVIVRKKETIGVPPLPNAPKAIKNPCKVCRGEGEIRMLGKTIDCMTCDGRGEVR